ncbi:TetR/AcrR family transcriptional regulator [Actinoplanes sp. NPDC051343]|uniref:TetR/AcrR family transcriptional regulator n=1 Tax=Actinoplanes sp. NPDC051343 TaxID=3363906 RepID=UPI003799AE28
MDRIVEEAQVTRATLYRHFPGKADLVLAYLSQVDQSIRAQADDAVAAGFPAAGRLPVRPGAGLRNLPERNRRTPAGARLARADPTCRGMICGRRNGR